MMRSYNQEIVDAVKSFLDENAWHYQFDSDAGIFHFGVNLHGKIKNVQYLVGINERDYIVYAISPLSVDQNEDDQMRKMSEFVCRANYGLRDGNFELDFRDGELRYKCFMNCNGVIPTMNMIGSSIHCPAAMFDRYGRGIVQILFNDMSAEDAIELSEGDIPSLASLGENSETVSSHLLDVLRRLREHHEKSSEDSSVTVASGE